MMTLSATRGRFFRLWYRFHVIRFQQKAHPFFAERYRIFSNKFTLRRFQNLHTTIFVSNCVYKSIQPTQLKIKKIPEPKLMFESQVIREVCCTYKVHTYIPCTYFYKFINVLFGTFSFNCHLHHSQFKIHTFHS